MDIGWAITNNFNAINTFTVSLRQLVKLNFQQVLTTLRS